MSKPLHVAMVAEGPTDFILLESVINKLVQDREVHIQMLQPEISEAFLPPASGHGYGWPGVYKWCRQTKEQGSGRISDSLLFKFHDILVVQLDADVAGKKYSDGGIDELNQDLPCEKPCPPAKATTDALRQVLLHWMGKSTVPARTILCTPSKSIETWVLVSLFPQHNWVNEKKASIECRKDPDKQLSIHPKDKKIVKSVSEYKSKANSFSSAWERVCQICPEADRFSECFRQLINQ